MHVPKYVGLTTKITSLYYLIQRSDLWGFFSSRLPRLREKGIHGYVKPDDKLSA